MTRRVVLVTLSAPCWAPPGVNTARWRHALAEDVVDLLTSLAQVEPAVVCTAEGRPLAEAIRWPQMVCHEVADLRLPTVLAAATSAGYEQAAMLSPDVPDLPAMLIGKLLRPLSSRPVAAAPATGGGGLIGLASRLPAPSWLPAVELASVDLAALRAAAPAASHVASSPGWHRLAGPADLSRLDPGLEGWDATRALLSA